MCISDFSHYSGNILKKREDINMDKIVQDMETAAANANLKIIFIEKTYSYTDKEAFCMKFKISDTMENMKNKQKRIIVYILSKAETNEQYFDWISEGAKLTYIINMEDIYEREKLVLDFLYEYLKLNPEDIFWNQCDWYYNYETIKEIKEKEFEKKWCYREPKIKGNSIKLRSNYKGNIPETGKKVITCSNCGKETYGKVERIEGKKYYGFYCIECEKWEMKRDKPVSNLLTFMDKGKYKLKLTGGENEYQLKRIAETVGISIEEARSYLPIGEEIIYEENTAKKIGETAHYLLICDVYFEIEPEFPFRIEGNATEEEIEEITERIRQGLEQNETS